MRRRRQSGDTRTGILSAAQRVFGRTEYSDVTINDILAEAKISRGTFYGYFASKEDVFAAVWGSFTRNIRQEMRLPGTPGAIREPRETDPRQVRRLVYERVLVEIKAWRREPALMRATVVFKALHPDFALPVLDASRESIHTAAMWIERDKEAGHLNDVQPKVATFALAAMLEWFLFEIFGTDFISFPELGDEDLAEQLTALWFNGVYKPERSPKSSTAADELAISSSAEKSNAGSLPRPARLSDR